MGRLTKTQLVATALSMVGNTAITTIAELWLDLILDAAARDYRFPELATTHSAAWAATIAYPSDYAFLIQDPALRAYGYLTDSGGGKSLIGMLGHGTALQGESIGVADDRANSRWLCSPTTGMSEQLTLFYQKNPASVAAGAVVWYPNDMAIIGELTALAEAYERGNQVALQVQIKEASKRLALRAPSRAQLWVQGGASAGLDPRMFG